MPIIRGENGKFKRGPSQLRPIKHTKTQKAKRASGDRREQSPLPVIANPDLIAEEALLEGPRRREDGQGSHDMLAPSSKSVGIRTPLLAMEVEKSLTQRDNPAHLGSPSSLQEFLQESAEGTATEVDLVENDTQPIQTSGSAASESASDVRPVEDVGIPIDKAWNIDGLVDKRLCPYHGWDYLLQYSDRWMSASDFGVSRAKVELTKKLRRYELNMSTLKPQKQASEVGCDLKLLWTEVDTPLQQDDTGERFLIRWKPRWTDWRGVDLAWAENEYKKVMEERRRREGAQEC